MLSCSGGQPSGTQENCECVTGRGLDPQNLTRCGLTERLSVIVRCFLYIKQHRDGARREAARGAAAKHGERGARGEDRGSRIEDQETWNVTDMRLEARRAWRAYRGETRNAREGDEAPDLMN